ncbi:efflux transporter periplasmic adaptor subunit, partial [Pseudomonas syringae]
MTKAISHLRYPLTALALIVISACGRASEATSAPGAAKVSVAKVLEQPVNEWDEFTGRLEAPETVEARPRVSGPIDQVAFTAGSPVKKGDRRFQLAPPPFQSDVRRRRAQSPPALPTASRRDREAQR